MQCSTRRQSSQDVAVVVISTRHDCLFHCVISDEFCRTPSQHGTRTVVLLLYCPRAASEWQQQHCTILACEHVSSALRCSSCMSTGLPNITVGISSGERHGARAASEWQQQHCTVLACEHVSSAQRCSSCMSTGLPNITVGFYYFMHIILNTL